MFQQLCQLKTCNNSEIIRSLLSHHKSMWCLEDYKVVSSQLFASLNRLFTAVLLVALLISCQEIPQNNFLETPLENQRK